jgi:hypothetical protein
VAACRRVARNALAAFLRDSRNALAAFLRVSRNALAAFLRVSRNALAAFLQGQTHGPGAVVGHRQTDRASTNPSEAIQGVAIQALDRGEKHGPVGRRPIRRGHIQESPSSQIEQTAFRLVHVTVDPCGKELL